MSKWEDSHDEILHDTPAEKDTVIRAMETAGYTLDTIESTDGHLRFFGEGRQTMTMAGWQECEAWLDGIINNLPDPEPVKKPDPMKEAKEAGAAAERTSILEKLREEERTRRERPPRPFLPGREERCLE